MRRLLIPALALGLMWNAAATLLMGGRIVDIFNRVGLSAGLSAGLFATAHTVWSRRKRDGSDTVLQILSNYYLAILVYWVGLIGFSLLWTQHWIGLHDARALALSFLVFGTIPHGLYLIPACLVSREFIWFVHERRVPA